MSGGTALFSADFHGSKGPGEISVPDLKSGDIVVALIDNDTGQNMIGNLQWMFEAKVSVDGEFKQLANADYSIASFTGVFFRTIT